LAVAAAVCAASCAAGAEDAAEAARPGLAGVASGRPDSESVAGLPDWAGPDLPEGLALGGSEAGAAEPLELAEPSAADCAACDAEAFAPARPPSAVPELDFEGELAGAGAPAHPEEDAADAAGGGIGVRVSTASAAMADSPAGP